MNATKNDTSNSRERLVNENEVEKRAVMEQASIGKKPSAGRAKHGLTILKRAVNGLGNRAIDRRTATGKALAKWRRELIQDLGGNVSTQQSAIIDLAVRSKLLLDSIDTWLLVQPSLVNSRKKSVLPVVMQRQTLADGLARYMSLLGLERQHGLDLARRIMLEKRGEKS
jgi:hypothetical protein